MVATAKSRPDPVVLLSGAKHPPRSSQQGFTLLELMIVMVIISLLAAIAIPSYTNNVRRAKEAVLKEDLHTMRLAIDSYTIDKQKAPQALDDLVREGYLRQIPLDPMTSSNQTWRVIMEDTTASVNQNEPGIFDVRSGADQTSLEGTAYSEW